MSRAGLNRAVEIQLWVEAQDPEGRTVKTLQRGQYTYLMAIRAMEKGPGHSRGAGEGNGGGGGEGQEAVSGLGQALLLGGPVFEPFAQKGLSSLLG